MEDDHQMDNDQMDHDHHREHRVDDVAGRPGPEDEAERTLRQALAGIDRVDDVQQRFLSEARRQVSELHLEAARARAAAHETARKVVADAQAEAASVLEAAREEAARLRAESEHQVKAHAEVLLAVAHKERDDLMAAARAAADRLREEGAVTGESLLNTAQAKAVRLVQEAKEEAARIKASSGGAGAEEAPTTGSASGEGQLDTGPRPAGTDTVAQDADLRRLERDVRALAEGLGQALDGLAARIAVSDGLAARIADSAGWAAVTEPARPHGPDATDATEATEVPPTDTPEVTEAPVPVAPPACGDPVPLIGSRGNQGASSAPPSPGSASHAASETQLHPQGAGPARRGGQWDHSPDWPRVRRGPGWRRRGA